MLALTSSKCMAMKGPNLLVSRVLSSSSLAFISAVMLVVCSVLVTLLMNFNDFRCMVFSSLLAVVVSVVPHTVLTYSTTGRTRCLLIPFSHKGQHSPYTEDGIVLEIVIRSWRQSSRCI